MKIPIGQLDCNILLNMFPHGMIEYHGLDHNLKTMNVNTILV